MHMCRIGTSQTITDHVAFSFASSLQHREESDLLILRSHEHKTKEKTHSSKVDSANIGRIGLAPCFEGFCFPKRFLELLSIRFFRLSFRSRNTGCGDCAPSEDV